MGSGFWGVCGGGYVMGGFYCFLFLFFCLVSLLSPRNVD